MRQLFPLKQVSGFIFSLVFTFVALMVVLWEMSFTTGMTILLITAFAQAGVQLVVFMHAGETKDKSSIFTNLFYAIVIALATIFGTLLAMVWNM